MPQHNSRADSPADCGPVFTALADPTRRAVLEALGAGPASVGALAEPHAMALPSFLRHVEVLEAAGLVTTEKIGRKRMVQLRAEGLAPATGWLAARGALAAQTRQQAVAERLAQPEPGAKPTAQPATHPTAQPVPKPAEKPRRLLPPWATRR